MNEFAFHGEVRWQHCADTLEDLSINLAGMPLGPLRNRSGFPDRELAAVLGIEPVAPEAPTPDRLPRAAVGRSP